MVTEGARRIAFLAGGVAMFEDVEGIERRSERGTGRKAGTR